MLLVDKRDGSREISAYLPDGSYQLTFLDSADVAFLGYGPEGPLTYPVGIERKAYYDLVECFRDGRLNSQIQRMTNSYRKLYLVVEGRPRTINNGHLLIPRKIDGKVQWVESKLTYFMIDNYLNTLTDECRIQVKRSFNLEETGWQVIDIYTHCSTDKHGSHLKMDTSWEVNPFMPPSFKKRVAAQLDLVGEKKAEDAAAHFACVRDMANAEEAEWKKIQGFGKVLARNVYNQFRGLKN